MKRCIKPFLFTLLLAPAAVMAQLECPAPLALHVGDRYFVDDDYDLNLASGETTLAQILGEGGPYVVTVVSSDGTPVRDILSYTIQGSTLRLQGIGPGSTVMEIITPDQDRLRLRLHVDSSADFVPPRLHLFHGGVVPAQGQQMHNRIRLREHAELGGVLCPFADQVGEVVDVMVVVQVENPDGTKDWYYLTGPGQFVRWDKRLSTLQPYAENFALQRGAPITIFEGPVPRLGQVKIFTGYLGDDGLVYETSPEIIDVEE